MTVASDKRTRVLIAKVGLDGHDVGARVIARGLLDDAGASDIGLIAGGVIPQEDIETLRGAGVAKVFLSGTTVQDIVDFIAQGYGGRP